MNDIQKTYQEITDELDIVFALAKRCEERSTELLNELKDLVAIAKDRNSKYITPEGILREGKI